MAELSASSASETGGRVGEALDGSTAVSDVALSLIADARCEDSSLVGGGIPYSHFRMCGLKLPRRDSLIDPCSVRALRRKVTARIKVPPATIANPRTTPRTAPAQPGNALPAFGTDVGVTVEFGVGVDVPFTNGYVE